MSRLIAVEAGADTESSVENFTRDIANMAVGCLDSETGHCQRRHRRIAPPYLSWALARILSPWLHLFANQSAKEFGKGANVSFSAGLLQSGHILSTPTDRYDGPRIAT